MVHALGTMGRLLAGAALVFALISPAAAQPRPRNGDLSDALKFIRENTAEDLEDYKEFIDPDPDEALVLLLDTGEDLFDEPARPRPPPFETLGDTRLNYEALAGIIRDAAAATGLPEALIDAVIRTESGYRPKAVSRTGARGLMQLMPATAKELGVRDAFDPRQNVMGGAKYLRKMLDRFGSLRLAIAAYNAGPGNVAKYNGVPPFRETQRYVAAVSSRYQNSKIAGMR